MGNEEIAKEIKLTYDDRRKELTQIKTQKSENKTEEITVDGKVTEKEKLISTVDHSMNVVYTEEGIRLAYKNLAGQRTNVEQRIAQLKKSQEELTEMPEDLKKLKKQLETLQKYTQAEKSMLEYKALQENLKEVNADINQIKETIGTRLKL